MKELLVVAALLLAGCATPSADSQAEPTTSDSPTTAPDTRTTDIVRTGHAMEGAKLPVYTATPLGAASGELADHAGNVLLITTWASWCTICKGDEPIWDSLHADFAAEGLTVFAVSREASESSARGYFESKEFRYPAFWDDGVNMALGMRDYQPNHMLVDRDGIIQSVYEGSLRARPGGEDGLRADVAALLG